MNNDNNWTSITAGSNYVLALKSDGTLWAWGQNSNGQLGNGNIVDQNSPQQVETESNWVGMMAGFDFILAYKGDGSVWGCGQNNSGQLGEGSLAQRENFVLHSIIVPGVLMSTFSNHSTTEIKTDGTLWTWGENTRWMLGDGTNITRYSPVKIGTDNNWVSISSGSDHTMALKVMEPYGFGEVIIMAN